MKNSFILVPFNASLEDVCDYAGQTISLLSSQNDVFGVALNNPLSLYRQFKNILRGEFLVQHWGIPVLRPIMIIPFQRFKCIRRFNIVLTVFLLNLWIFFRFRKKRKILWFFEPRYLSIFIRFLYHDRSLYDCVDNFFGYKSWRKEHRWCLKNASRVSVNSRTLQKRFRHIRSDLKVVPLGFSPQNMPESFVATQKKSGSLTQVFVGAVGDRLDFVFLKKLFLHRPKDTFVFMGPKTFTDSKRGRQKKLQFEQWQKTKILQWVPQQPRKDMWRKARNFDVGLIPYESHSEFDAYSFPMKTMEYFYIGLPIVASVIKELSLFPRDVYQPQKEGWTSLSSFLYQGNSEDRRRRRKFSLTHTWEKKLAHLYTLIENSF